jgi:c-di-GMP-binding flagellar brake protein YcgR
MINSVRDPSIHDTVTVEADIDGLSVMLSGFVTNILDQELWLATRLPDERVSRLRPGQCIHLTLDRDGPVILESTFLRRLGDSGRFDAQRSRVFAVRRPADIAASQRRAHVRADLERDVRIRSVGAAGAGSLGVGRTVNLSAGGALFATSMPLLFGEELLLAIALAPHNIVIAGGSIVRLETPDSGAGNAAAEDRPDPPGSASPGLFSSGAAAAEPTPSAPALTRVAVRFDRISEADQERITCHLLQMNRQSRSIPTSTEISDELASAVAADTSSAEAAEAAGAPSSPPPAAPPTAVSEPTEATDRDSPDAAAAPSEGQPSVSSR